MPKQKTRKSAVKRFKITKKGKVLRGHQYARHRRAHKSKRRIRSYHRPVALNKQQEKKIKRMLGLK